MRTAIEQLPDDIETLKRMVIEREEQVEANLPPAEDAARPASQVDDVPAKDKPARRPLPEHLPRTTQEHAPDCGCPHCGTALKRMGEDVSEYLEFVPEHFKVIRTVRPKMSCPKCSTVVQAPMPSRPIPKGIAGPGLLAHVAVSKYLDHQPLYRQSEIYGRQGIDLDRSTMAGWIGAISTLVEPLVDALGRYVVAGTKIHAD